MRFQSYFFISLFIVLAHLAKAQQPAIEPQDTSSEDRINVDFADVFEFQKAGSKEIQKLIGNVQLHQDSVFMYCDSAIISNNNEVLALGKVLIQQGKSVHIFSDSLLYDATLRIADLYGKEVIFENGASKLFTTQLNYDLNNKIATYQTESTLVNDSTFLISNRGTYFVNEKEAFFKGNVRVKSSDLAIRTDSLQYNSATKTLFFHAPAKIIKDTAQIYCESGYYERNTDDAMFAGNPQYQTPNRKAWGDTIRYNGNLETFQIIGKANLIEPDKQATADNIRYDGKAKITMLEGNAHYIGDNRDIVAEVIKYNEETRNFTTSGRSKIEDGTQYLEANMVDYDEATGEGKANGEVYFRDSAEDMTIVCEVIKYNKKNDYIKAVGGREGRPMMITIMDGDSLFMAADTLISLRLDTSGVDTSRSLLAYKDVRLFSNDLQGLCDSLVYHEQDSIFWMFKQPILWSDTSQFSADTIKMKTVNDNLDNIQLISKAFIINQPEDALFNQVKGRNIIARFEEDELRVMNVKGNAESVYYPKDDNKAYIGVNKTTCSNMNVFFGNNEVTGIRFYSQPTAVLSPMRQTNQNTMRLENFLWQIERQPKSVDDLFTKKTVQ